MCRIRRAALVLVTAVAVAVPVPAAAVATSPAGALGDPDWDPPVPLGAAVDDAHDVEVATTPAGDAWVGWITGDARALLARRTPTGTWGAPEQVTPSGLAVTDVDLSAGADGTLAVAAAGTAGGPLVQVRVRRPGGTLGAPVTLDQAALRPPAADPGTGAEAAALDLDVGPDGTVTAAWITAPGDVRAARLAAGSTTWGPSATVDGSGSAQRVDAVTTAPLPAAPPGAGAPAASVVVHTADTPAAGPEDEVRAAARRGGGWTAPTVLVDAAVPPLPVAVADGTGALLAWVDGSAPARVMTTGLTVSATGSVAVTGPAQPVSPADRAASAPAATVSTTGQAVLAWSQATDVGGSSDWTVGLATRPVAADWSEPTTAPGMAVLRPGSVARVTVSDTGDVSVGGDLAGGGAATVVRRGDAWGPVATVAGAAAGVTRTAAAPDGRITLAAVVGAAPLRQAMVQETPMPPPAPRGRPAVTGDAALGASVTCDPGDWARAASFAYAWLRGSSLVPSRTDATYPVGADDVGAQLRCRVTAANAAGSAVAVSDPVGVPTAPVASGPVTLTEPVRVGDPVECRAPSFAPAARRLGFSWLRDDTALSGAGEATYTPRAADLGRSLRCRVEATGAGGTATVLSEARAVARGARLASTARPRVVGRPRVGADVTCTVGRWVPEQTGVRVRWLVDGRALRRVDVPRLRIPAQARGDRLRCVVTATRPGHPVGRARSRPLRVR